MMIEEKKTFDWIGATRIGLMVLGMLLPLIIAEVSTVISLRVRMATCEQWMESDTERSDRDEKRFTAYVSKQENEFRNLMDKLDRIRSSQDQMIGRLGSIITKLED